MVTTGYNVAETVIAAGGNVYIAPVGTAPPAGLADPADPWENVGYISVEGVTFTPAQEVTTFDSWQQRSIRLKSAGQTLQLGMSLLQFTPENLLLAFGGGSVTEAGGVSTWTPPDPTAEFQRAVIVDAQDGSRRYRFYMPNAAVAELGETTFNADNLAELPVVFQAQPGLEGEDSLQVLIPVSAAVFATGATAGAPGTWSPGGSTPPLNAADATSKGVTATPTATWTTGQYVQGSTAGTGGEMHWNGTAWTAGKKA